jgi:hypothetical protein
MVSVACRKCPTRMVGRELGVTNGGYALTLHHVTLILNGEQGNSGVIEDR